MAGISEKTEIVKTENVWDSGDSLCTGYAFSYPAEFCAQKNPGTLCDIGIRIDNLNSKA